MEGLRLGVVDDHPPILRGVIDGLRDLLDPVLCAVTAATVPELLASGEDVSMVLLDIHLNDDSDPAENVEILVSRGWPVLLYTQEHRASVVSRCFRAGASGLVNKHEDLAVLAGAIRRVAAGEPHFSPQWAASLADDTSWRVPDLTSREAEALRYYATGLPLKSVARRMNIAQDTAKEYLIRTRRKYAQAGRPAATKTELYIRAVEDGHVPGPAG